jgi:hypothetical protein
VIRLPFFPPKSFSLDCANRFEVMPDNPCPQELRMCWKEKRE